MLLDVQWNDFKAAGGHTINSSNGKDEFIMNHQSNVFGNTGTFIKVTTNGSIEKGTPQLLKEIFEGRLRDQKGIEIYISEDILETYDL